MTYKFIPLDNNKKSLVNWKTGIKSHQDMIKQTNIGIVNSGNYACIDLDIPDYSNEIVDKLKDFGSIVETPSGGKHFYFIPETNYLGNIGIKNIDINNEHFGEIRYKNGYQGFPNSVFDIDMPNQLIYTPLNFSDLKSFEYNMSSLTLRQLNDLFPNLNLQDLILNTYKESLKSKDLLLTTNPLNTQYVTLLDCLPKGPRMNHRGMFDLLIFISKNGQWEIKDDIFEEWLKLNRFKRHSDNEYRKEWVLRIKGFKPEMIGVRLRDLRKESEEKVVEYRSFQDKVNQIVYLMCLELGNGGKPFWLACHALEGINPTQINRALNLLERKGILEPVVRSGGYGTGPDGHKATKYRLL